MCKVKCMVAVLDLEKEYSSSITGMLAGLGVEYKLTQNESDINKADKIIIPNITELNTSIRKLHLSNLFTLLRVVKKPVLGIGMGLNLLCENFEGTVCLGLIPDSLEKNNDKITNSIGLQEIELLKDNKLFKGIGKGSVFYFENVYQHPANQYTVAALKHYPEICAALQKEYFYGVQFLPEKSGEAGEKLLRNFVTLC